MHPARNFRSKPSRGLAALGLILGLASIPSASLTARAAIQSRAAVFSDLLPGFDQGLARELTAQVKAAGYEAQPIPTATLTNPSSLSSARYDLLVLPGARSLPLAAAPAIVSYLKSGGDLMALGLPAWQSPLFQVNGKWISRESYEATIAREQPRHMVEDFRQADLAKWNRATGEPGARAAYDIVTTDRGRALHVVIGHLGGWETIACPDLVQPFSTNHTLTCFRARGGPATRQLALEWAEQDGSRWIATVDLTTKWKSYALLPDAFKAWPVWPPQRHRARFQPQNAARFSVGLAMSHTALEGDRHEYWFADLGTAPNPFGAGVLPDEPEVPVLESLSPSYQCFPITTPVVVGTDYQKVGLEDWEERTGPQSGRTLLPTGTSALHPRPRGVGFDQARPFRWEPLLAAQDGDDYRGALGALVVNLAAPYRGSVWAAFTPQDAAFYRERMVSNCLRQVLCRMQRGLFLAEGGAEYFTVFAGQQFKVGARLVNFGRETVSNLTASVAMLDAKGAAQRAVLEGRAALGPGEERVFEQGGLGRSADEEQVLTSLSAGRTRIDALRHEFGVWQPRSKPAFIAARDGCFWREGKPWKAHGVNYMPSSGIGLANEQLFESWLGRGPYDPEVIDRDLRRVKDLGLNAVSVFVYHTPRPTQHLLDFLRRCEALDLQVNLSLRPGTPMNFRWQEMKELIEYHRLAQNNTVFAYDLAWEPSHGSQDQQQGYVKDWNAWVLKRYGGRDAAEKSWAFAAPAASTNSQSKIGSLEFGIPPMSQLTADGAWRNLVADYRLFLDDLLRERYAAARKLVKSIDPYHAVSFRMSCAGDPGYNWDAALPYDFYGLAEAVDIWAPEAYGRIGAWERVKGGEFTAAYGRLCDASKPLFWAEMGYNAWDMNRMAPDPQKLDFEGRYYADFYRMMIESGADGVFFWWYPGGFRRGEKSDFGIINPDGTDRPVTKVIRTSGGKFLRAAKPAKPNHWIVVDRDRDARGLYGIYETVKDEFWKAIAKGQRPGLRWAHEPGDAGSNTR